MIYVEKAAASPADEIARDDQLFADVDANGGECLRLWEPQAVAVVLGRGNREESEVRIENTRTDGVPVLRRSSGGGAVVLMPGCLCYTLVFDLERWPELFSAPATNRKVMTWLAEALWGMDERDVGVAGDSDLVIENRKIGGHAQRRGRRAILFHGCLLLDAQLERIGRYLGVPSRSPDYRGGRLHEEFVMNAGWSATEVGAAINRFFADQARMSRTTLP